MNVLLDTNIVLDILLKREPFYQNSRLAWRKCIKFDEIHSYISGHSIDNIDYILHQGNIRGKIKFNTIKYILEELTISKINQQVIHYSFNEYTTDLEDTITYASAFFSGIDVIITRNKKDFPTDGKVKLMTPEEFLQIDI